MAQPTTLQQFNVALSSNGAANGTVVIPTNNASMTMVGATVFLNDSTNTIGQECVVTSVDGTTGTIGIRFVRNEQTTNNDYGFGGSANYGPPQYGRTSCAAYLTANSAYMLQPAQLLFNGKSDDSSTAGPLTT